MSIAAIILAAGASRRLGRPKQLLSLHGQTLLERAVHAARNSLCQHVCVVMGANADECQEKIAHLEVEIVFNPSWEEGMASSIRCGLSAMIASHADLEGIIILACDQIAVSSDLLDQLVLKAPGNAMVASAYAGIVGIPAFFAAGKFAALLALQGDEGARRLLKNSANSVETIPFAAGAEDIDTEEGWLRVQSRLNDEVRLAQNAQTGG